MAIALFESSTLDIRAVATNATGQRYNGTTWEDHVDGNWSTYLITPTRLGTSMDVKFTVPSDTASVAVYDGTSPVVTDLAVGEVTFAARQPRYNKPAGRAFRLKLSSRADGTHKATSPARLRPGTVGDIAVSIDMSPLWDDEHVQTVGTPTVSGGSITCVLLGPRDTEAMVELAGTATASENVTVTVPVTMDSGEVVDVVFDVEVFAD